MTYRSVVLTKRGPPEVLRVVENELREPAPGEARIKVLAAGVGLTDVAMRYGYYPYAPKIPFVPGYDVVGVVDALGQGVSSVAVGDRVAALTVYGGYAETIYLGQEHLVPVPGSLDPAEAVALVLNYTTAYQMLHRSAQVKTGDKVLVTGASGGVGTALLQLGKLADLRAYGIASRSSHGILAELGVVPLDYSSQDFVEVIRAAEPDGLDFVFDGIGGDYIGRGFKVLRRGGKLVEYGYPGFLRMLLEYGTVLLLGALPNGKSGEFYGITALYRKDKQPFLEDLPVLFKLLGDGKLKPVIADRLPILEAAKANERLERGGVRGKIVLLAPELL